MNALAKILAILAVLLVPTVSTVAASVPQTQTALGINVTLSSVRRSGGVVRLYLSADAKPRGSKNVQTDLRGGGYKLLIDGKVVTPSAERWTERGKILEILCVNAAPSARELTVTLDLRTENLSHFAFSGISPAVLPLTKRVGPAVVILRRVYENARVRDNRWFYRPSVYNHKLYEIELEVKPAWITTPTYSYESTGKSETWRGCGEYEDHSDRSARLVDDAGRVHTVAETTWDTKLALRQSSVFRSGTEHYNVVEDVVKKVSSPLAGKLVNRRAGVAASRVPNRDVYLYAFDPIHPTPKKFTFDLTVPTLRSEATVTFKNVPCP